MLVVLAVLDALSMILHFSTTHLHWYMLLLLLLVYTTTTGTSIYYYYCYWYILLQLIYSYNYILLQFDELLFSSYSSMLQADLRGRFEMAKGLSIGQGWSLVCLLSPSPVLVDGH